MRFLADESCDFAVVRALRAAGHDVSTVSDVTPGAEDHIVAALANSESRVLLTEDKDFGQLAYATGHLTSGVVLVRYPAHARGNARQRHRSRRRRIRCPAHRRVRRCRTRSSAVGTTGLSANSRDGNTVGGDHRSSCTWPTSKSPHLIRARPWIPRHIATRTKPLARRPTDIQVIRRGVGCVAGGATCDDTSATPARGDDSAQLLALHDSHLSTRPAHLRALSPRPPTPTARA